MSRSLSERLSLVTARRRHGLPVAAPDCGAADRETAGSEAAGSEAAGSEAAGSEAAGSEAAGGGRGMPGDGQEAAGGGRIAEQLLAAGWREVHPLVYSRDAALPRPPRLPADTVHPHLVPEHCPVEQCLFWDTETTGLGGAGTVIFLVGFAWVEGDKLHFHQVFLADLPGERAFLEYLRSIISRFPVFVSYNGKAFDSSILRTRFVLSSMTMALGFQLDLLYLARRFWRRLTGDCRLTTIEQRVLGIERTGDVPGWMVPEIYFDSLRRGSLGQLPVVFRHNEHDVISLARLLGVVEQILRSDPGAGTDPAAGAVPVDRGAVGVFLVQRGDPGGVTLLHEAYAAGDVEAGRWLSLHLKRQGDWPGAVRLWEDLREAHGSLFAAVELSKFHEHRARNLEAALACILPFRVLERRALEGRAGAATGGAAAAAVYQLGRREARIRVKLARRQTAVLE